MVTMRLGGCPLLGASNSYRGCNLNSMADLGVLEGSLKRDDAESGVFGWSEW